VLRLVREFFGTVCECVMFLGRPCRIELHICVCVYDCTYTCAPARPQWFCFFGVYNTRQPSSDIVLHRVILVSSRFRDGLSRFAVVLNVCEKSPSL
jgi:hypothetical protein